jgi:1-acyl-sn-glycerol-3-phosphate acyltransferase
MPEGVDDTQRKWLPEADQFAHPFATWLLELGFDLYLCTVYRRERRFPREFRMAPGTLIASNHQRDVDGPMLGNALVRRRGLHFQAPLPFFATREDLFQPGILARLTVHWPAPVSAVLGHIPLRWFFSLARTEPMRRTREFTLGEALHALVDAGLGDHDAASVLNARGCRETGIAPGGISISGLLQRPEPTLQSWWGLRRLVPSARAAISADFRATVQRQLTHFANRLDQGHCVYFAPEGGISMDGHFARVRAGFYQLSCTARTAPWIQPMALGYDTLAPGRSRVVLGIGESFRADVAASRREFDANLRRAVLALVPITPSHLLARFLLHGPRTFTPDDLAGWLRRSHEALENNGVALDPLFKRVPIDRLASRRLHWLARKQLVARDGNDFRNTCPRGAAPGWRKPANIARYLDNGFADAVPDIGWLLPC